MHFISNTNLHANLGCLFKRICVSTKP